MQIVRERVVPERVTWSPGRAAAELTPRGWRAVLPAVYLVAAVLGLAALGAVAAGYAVTAWFHHLTVEMAPGPVPAFVASGPAVAGALIAGAVLLVCGVAGILRESGRDRERRRLLSITATGRRAEKVQPRIAPRHRAA